MTRFCLTAGGFLVLSSVFGCAPSTKLDAQAECEQAVCEGMAPWRNFGTLAISFAKAGAEPSYEFSYYSVGDEMHNTLAQPSAEPYSKMHIIPGAAILYFGRLASTECNRHYDTPAVLAGYATEILFYLSQAAPSGPDTIQNTHKFSIQEKDAPTRVQIDPGNYISFKSPWKIEGELTRENADAIRFAIHETFSGDIKEERQLAGYWSKDGPDSLITNETSLDGWLVCPMGDTKIAQEYQTFGDIRSIVSE
ncbi:MAG: hypothetical protein ACREVE_14330 [Gammaproteobacteria bacterium]